MVKKQLYFRPAAPDELQIDLDRPRARITKRLLRLVSEHAWIGKPKYSRSKSGKTHVSIPIKSNIFCSEVYSKCPWNRGQDHRLELDIFERLLLQCALGSDPVRELLSWGRARNGCPYPTLFFEEKK